MENLEKQKFGVPALLSFFVPGLGQLIKGQILKAILIWIVGGAIGFLFFWTIVVPFAIWVWNIYDAYNSNTNRLWKSTKAIPVIEQEANEKELGLIEFVLLNLAVFAVLYCIYRFCLK